MTYLTYHLRMNDPERIGKSKQVCLRDLMICRFFRIKEPIETYTVMIFLDKYGQRQWIEKKTRLYQAYQSWEGRIQQVSWDTVEMGMTMMNSNWRQRICLSNGTY